MGKRTLRGERKLNFKKVFLVIVVGILLVGLICISVKSISDLVKNHSNSQENLQEDSLILEESIEDNKKTIEEIIAEFGGEIKEKVKEDTYYIAKDGMDYTAYLDGEIVSGRIIPWSGDEAKPAIDEAGNINIYSAAELAWVANRVINGEKNFSGVTITLRNNIDLGAREKEDGTWDGNDWKAIIGFLDELPEKQTNVTENTSETYEDVDVTNENLKRFDGIFNGNGFSIRGLKIDTEKRYQGLFGYLSGTVSDLTIKYSKINGGEGTGTIAGLSEGRILNCKVENTLISGKDKIGGLVGIAMTESTIESSSVLDTCDVKGENNVGGLIGYSNNNVIIKSSSNGAKITGKDYVGGITGISFYGTTIQNCFNFSKSIEAENYVGGLVGYSAAQIEKSYNQDLSESNGIISGKNYVGGLVGLNYIMGDITECFNNGNIIVLEDNCGGIAGLNNSNISNCYNKGQIDCNQATGLKIGGLVGQNLSDSYIYTSYNIGNINNKNYAGGVVGADFGTVSKSFCIENCLEEQNGENNYNKTEEDMKNNILSELGEIYIRDIENKNSGYPIFGWQ